MPRIAPATPPYEPQIAEALLRIMPPGVEPLLLFRTMAKSPRVFAKMFAGGLLDKGPLALRHREIVIDSGSQWRGHDAPLEWRTPGEELAQLAQNLGRFTIFQFED